MLGLNRPDGAERVSWGLDSFDRAREIAVKPYDWMERDAGSGSFVEPEAALAGSGIQWRVSETSWGERFSACGSQ